MGRSRHKVVINESIPYFVTCTIIDWIPLFGNTDLVTIAVDSLKYLQEHNDLKIHAYVIMKDHLHMIVSVSNLSGIIRQFKSFTARSIVDYLRKNNDVFTLSNLRNKKLKHKIDQEFQVWQEGFHPEPILNMAMLKNTIEYIHYNPVKSGLAQFPDGWIYSSHNDYQGKPGKIRVELIGI